MQLCLTGLAMTVAAKVGMFNVGGEGQLYLGAMAAAVTGIFLTGAAKPAAVLLSAAAAAAAGGGVAESPAGDQRSDYHHNAQFRGHLFLQMAGQRAGAD